MDVKKRIWIVCLCAILCFMLIVSGTQHANAVSAGDGTFIWPVNTGNTITAGWTYSGGGAHGATDFAGSYRDIFATASGTVVTVVDSGCTGSHGSVQSQYQCSLGSSCKALSMGNNGSYANYIVISHGNNFYSLYAHLKTGSILVKSGDAVSQGQKIATMGNAGNTAGTTGIHLHFEIRSGANDYSHRVDPQNYLTKTNTPSVPVTPKNKVTFDLQGGSVGTYTQQAAIAGTNCERGYNSIVYNVSGATVATNKWGKEAAVDANGKIIAYREYESDTQIKVPSGGFVVSQHQQVQLSEGVVWGSKLGDYIGVDYANMKAYLYTDVDSYLVNHKQVEDGAAYGTLPTPTRDGYTFDGWYTAASGGTKITESSKYSVNKLYAHWAEIHNYVPTVYAPVCEEQGYTEYICTICNASYQDDYTAALGHDYEHHTVKQATCTTPGSFKDVCKRCGRTETGQIDALGHSYEYVTVEGDCVTPPVQRGTCRRCGDVTETIIDDAWSAWSTTIPTGVDSSDIQSRKEYSYRTKQTITSTESGLSGWTLEGTTQVWDEYGGWSWWTTDKLTASDSTEIETAKVYRYYYFLCNKCGGHNPLSGGCSCGGTSNDFHEYWTTVPYSGSNSSVVSYATHKRTTTSVGGGTVYYFSSGNLNDTAIGTKDSGSSAAVIAQGYRSRTRTSHTEYTYYKWSAWSEWSATAVTATSTREVETRTVYRYNLYANAAHDYSYAATKAPTTSATGTLTGTCSKCSATTTVTLPKLDTTNYSYDEIQAATCTANGTGRYTWKTTTYGSFYFGVSLSATGHNRTYKLTTAPTISATGTLTGTCSKCSGTTTVSLPKLDTEHYYVTVIEEPTSTTVGTAKYTLKDTTYGTVTISVTLPKIAQLVLPSALTRIETEAFANVSAETIVIPANVKAIDELAFANCPNLRYLVFQGNPTTIASNILEGCSNVTIRCTSGGYVSRWAAIMGYAVEAQ